MATRAKPPSAAPPRWQCQQCQRPLEISDDVEAPTSAALAGSGAEAGAAGFGSTAHDRGEA